MTRCWKRITALTLLAGLLAASAQAQGGRRGILGVVDGERTKAVEGAEGAKWRKDFLRKIGYKR